MKTLRELEVSRAFPARCLRIRHERGPFVLRPTVVTDAETIVDAIGASIPELLPFMPWAHGPQTLVKQIERLRDCEADYYAGRDFVMGLFPDYGDPGDRDMLAMVGLHPRVPLNPKALEVGYWAPTRHANKGWTTFAVQIAVVYAIDALGADRVQVSCDETNLPSRRVIEKCGFVPEGRVRALVGTQTAALVEAGYKATGMSLTYAHFPDTVDKEPWVASVRASIGYVNLAGFDAARAGS